MEMPTFEPNRPVWRFADCEFDELRYELRVSGRVIELERKPLDLLRHLLSKPGEIFRKEELLETVWPGVLVVDASLATAVSKLRRALGDRDVIQTVPKVGYRIAVPVTRMVRAESFTENTAPPASVSPFPEAGHPQPPRRVFALHILWSVAAIALLAAVSFGVLVTRNRHRAPTTPVRVAILPFQNVSGNQSLEYLASALPDEVAHSLATARLLQLRPVAEATRFSGRGVDFRKIGRDLEVSRVVTGHFVMMGDRLQVTMEAVDTGQDRIVWHDTFSVASGNLVSLQEQIAAVARGRLARALGVTEFLPEQEPRATSEEAYELYLKSVDVSFDPVPNRQGIDLLRHVVTLDPTYAPAWGMLALRYYVEARFDGGGQEMMDFSDAAAEKELALNPDSLDPLAELTIHRTERGDLVKAHRIAIDLLRRRPDDPNLHHVLNYVLRYGGSLHEAGRECDLVTLLAARVIWGSCSTTFMELGDYKRAMYFLRKDLSSEWSKAHAIEVHLREGNTSEALNIPAPQIPHWDSYKMLLACARHASDSEIQAMVSKVEVDDDPEVDYFFAAHLAYCGQTPASLRMLRIAIDRNYCSYPAMDKDPFFDSLRTNPQFLKLRQAGIACHDDFTANREKTVSNAAVQSPLD
jgi:DNA-binding winged helix-turn-helix (wHTH) protein/TolB-like protein